MDEFDADSVKATLDFFILKLFGDGSLSELEMERRAKPIYTFLELVAARKGRQSLGSLRTALRRLQREGWLTAERELGEQLDPAMVCSLTAAGERRLAEELTRRGSIVSQFVEDGDLDKSFRNFLDRRAPRYGT
jgi:DNA-binding PadR family transcriptional regulator